MYRSCFITFTQKSKTTNLDVFYVHLLFCLRDYTSCCKVSDVVMYGELVLFILSRNGGL